MIEVIDDCVPKELQDYFEIITLGNTNNIEVEPSVEFKCKYEPTAFTETSKPFDIYFFEISGVNAILFSIFLSSEVETIFINKYYSKNIAIKTKTTITATVPHVTNFVKLFHVFLWLSLSIKIIFVLL